MKQENKDERRWDRMEYIARTAVCVIDSVDQFLGTLELSETDKTDIYGTLICEIAIEMTKSYAGVCCIGRVLEDIENSLRKSPIGKQETMQ